MNLSLLRSWFPPHCEVLHDARRQIITDAKLSPEFTAELAMVDPAELSRQWYGSLRKNNGQLDIDDILNRSTATLNGLRAAILAAENVILDKPEAHGHLRTAVAAFRVAWGLTAHGEKARFMDIGGADAPPWTLQAMLDARIAVDEGTAPAWLAVHRLVDFLCGATAPALDRRAKAGDPANPVRVRMLFDAGHFGRIVDATAAVQAEGPASWYVDPSALGAMVLTKEFVTSLQIGWRAAWAASVRQQTDPTAVRITPEWDRGSESLNTQKYWLFSGPSAGALMACAMYGAVTRTELDSSASASVELTLETSRSRRDGRALTAERIPLEKLRFAPVSGLENKLDAAHRVKLRKIVLHSKDYQEALKQRLHITDNWTIKLVEASTFRDVFRELSGNARMELALDEFSNAQARDWEEDWTGISDVGRELGLANYVPPRYAVLRPDRAPQNKSAMRRTDGPVGADEDYEEVTGATEEQVLQTLLDLERSGPLLCLSEGPGAGKTVFTRRVLGFVSSQAGRDALFDGRGCLAMRWEDGTYGRRWPKDLRRDLLAYDRFQECCARNDCEPGEVYDYALANGRIVVILDSLDQANKKGRAAILSFISNLVAGGRTRSGIRVILTGRPYAVEKIREPRLPAASWRFGKVLPFNARQQYEYLRGPQAPDHESPEAWRHRIVAQGVTKPVLGLESVAAVDSDEEAAEILKDKISHYHEIGDLLGNPQSLAYIRRLALRRKGKIAFSTRSGLYAKVTANLLREGFKRSTGRSPSAAELELANAMLAATAFQMMVRNPRLHVANGETTIARLHERSERRFKKLLDRSRFRGRPERAWAWLKRVSVLSNGTLLTAATELTLAWPDQRLMEYYAGLHLARNAEPGWYRDADHRDTDQRIRCGDSHVRRHAADERWFEPWRFAIEMPAANRDRRVLLASLSELYEPVTQPTRKQGEAPWLRPTELMYRAWCLLEDLPAYERGQPSPTQLPGGARVLSAFRAQYARQLSATDQRGAIARALNEGFVTVPSLVEGELDLTKLHRVSLESFQLGRTAVTREQYELFDGSYALANKSLFDSYKTQSARCPANKLSWYDAWCAARYFGSRLPTEVEWEYACGAGARTKFCRITSTAAPGYRDLDRDEDLKLVADFGRNWEAGPLEVGQYRPNYFGLYDMHGGVWEWCASWEGTFSPTSLAGPADGSDRVGRGGGWDDPPWLCRTARRFWDSPGFRFSSLGFRLALVRSG
jgi:hypothetical protein